ncbi:MAG: hypothetical protein P4L22_04915 [Candidatus Babeliales bacterium]|nr:hypothetical protein [Candidatus Babeliales bacterium]
MLNYKKIFLILSILLPLNSKASEECISNDSEKLSEKITSEFDEINYGITQELFEYLKTKEVPYELKKDLDKIFYDEDVMLRLSKIYNNKNPLWSQESLIEEGFEFLPEVKLGNKSLSTRIFRHVNFPNWIFKIASHWNLGRCEMINAKRIKYAEFINKNGRSIIRAPIKYAYMPYIFKSESLSLPVCYQSLPICIVVSEYINKKTMNEDEFNLSEKAKKILDEDINYFDCKANNIIELEDYYLIIDTEDNNA